MKEGINNSRGSSMYKIIENLSSKKVKVLVYDPTVQELDIVGAELIQSFNDFTSQSKYHLFIKYGDKVYMEVKDVGEIVISFAELQNNNYWNLFLKYTQYLAL